MLSYLSFVLEHFTLEMLWRRQREAPPPAHGGVGEIHFRPPLSKYLKRKCYNAQ
jgi:hypothetical protein